jgi:hypothetical protein
MRKERWVDPTRVVILRHESGGKRSLFFFFFTTQGTVDGEMYESSLLGSTWKSQRTRIGKGEPVDTKAMIAELLEVIERKGELSPELEKLRERHPLSTPLLATPKGVGVARSGVDSGEA